MRYNNFIKSRTHIDTFGESRNVPGVQLLTSQKKSRESWHHPPYPSSCPFHSLTSFLSSLQRRGELGHTPVSVAAFTPQNADQKCPQEDEKGCRKSEQAHVFGLEVWHLWKEGCLQICLCIAGVYKGEEGSVEMEDLGSAMSNV